MLYPLPSPMASCACTGPFVTFVVKVLMKRPGGASVNCSDRKPRRRKLQPGTCPGAPKRLHARMAEEQHATVIRSFLFGDSGSPPVLVVAACKESTGPRLTCPSRRPEQAISRPCPA